MSAIPKTQTAYGYERGKGSVAKYENVPVKQPGDNQLLLKIEAAGLCQSDLHILKVVDEEYPANFIMGHEIAGQIVQVGKNLASDPKYQLGSRYSLCICKSCGVCKNCRKGLDMCCDEVSGYGIGTDGGFQQYIVVENLRSLVPIPEGVSYQEAAVATDSVLTPYHAIRKVQQFLEPTTRVLLFGLGGLGLNALQILRTYGCYVVAVDRKADLEAQAKRYGAAEFYTDIGDSNHPTDSFDICFDFCGYKQTFEDCQDYIARDGKLVIVGLGNLQLNYMNFYLARKEVTIYANFGGTAGEQLACLELVRLGKVKPLIKSVSIDELPYYFDQLAKGKVEGRIVFTPPKL
ncbi:alcohol dehydrogenase [Yamadazyma tenuis]|uniref:alcohol dehydrogenase n=1 Tax=Candida tenuis (strain ATCC 10573 / BCRC 21748 / CBS 615 / JCM 9827 / NBRC 10315 / NRRL Y-1498 / VKM Y-70) TaxID=590646 RepID=G3BB23_CANTC|nr:uncharacterized protein CANTEDRAFT_115586 [Yamadazyma tenuis ATCC 10573]XP_006688957.1 GroES-like protein [Yamadazyma tenuis ATCC 10573]EGV62786.1 hypothetical protein CANTEDRAFT_115586 [Yamadazyma tenuis ATCC 10573]EGV62787.1 GroES-like protein [Yamadazyma tenuis ATCC 10573]WEJ93377.1 alcohol dehydrogenase [Yamadazyma tenuis]